MNVTLAAGMILGFLLATAYGAAFHIIMGGPARHVILYLFSAWLGFALGHLIGDWVLKNVIYTIKELIEENMIIARLGGEEFCVVVSDTTPEIMHKKLEVMRQAIEHLDCSEAGTDLSVTASFGFTSSETSGYSLPLLLTHADVALFEAKNKGRNQIVMSDAVRK